MRRKQVESSSESLQKTFSKVGYLLYETGRSLLDGVSRMVAPPRRMRAVRRLGDGRQTVVHAPENDVDRAMRELGEMLYGTHAGNPTEAAVLLAKMEEIDALKRSAEEEATAQAAAEAEHEAAGSAENGAGQTVPLCPHCARETVPGARFCIWCGKRLSAAETDI